MNTTIYLIRHGEVEYDYKDGKPLVYGKKAKLSDRGKEKIAELALAFKRRGINFEGIYSSPLTRAVQSAEFFAAEYKSPIQEVEDLSDVESPASEMGMTMDELKAMEGDTYSLQGHESQVHMSNRMKATLRKILEENEGKTIGLVSHGDPIRILIFGLKNPDKELPSMKELAKSDYIDKSQAWRLVFDPEFNLIESEVITAEGSINPPERKF